MQPTACSAPHLSRWATLPSRMALTVILATSALAGCASAPGPTPAAATTATMPMTNAEQEFAMENEHMAYLTGSATWPGAVALPPGATFEAQLIDHSRADIMAPLLGRHQQALGQVLGRDVAESPHQPVVRFRIPYDSAAIDPRMRYMVRATVSSAQGQLLLTTDTVTPVLTHGAGTALAQPLRLVPTAAAAANTTHVTTARPADPASGAIASAPLLNTYWRILSLEGQPVVVRGNQREPHLVLADDDRQPPRARVYAGCNQISGGYTVNGTELTFARAMMSTKKACVPPLGEQEARLSRVLATQPLHWRIDGQQLTLRNPQGQVLLQARAEAMR
ncbi:META domain-containing protein [Ottowia sp.]|uniref:META domain-containing protein n=1 Tax=Ottowia sp. TaxID=1898956 RepID=UPI003A8C114D